MSLTKKVIIYAVLTISLVVIYAFFSFYSLVKTKNFLETNLYFEINIARELESLSNSVIRLYEYIVLSNIEAKQKPLYKYSELIDNLEKKINNLINIFKYSRLKKEEIVYLEGLINSFLKASVECHQLYKQKEKVLNLENSHREYIYKKIVNHISGIYNRISTLISDTDKMLQDKDFQASFLHTNSLVTKIYRISKDLQVIQNEISSFVNSPKSKIKSQILSKHNSQEQISERILTRLQAVIGLVSKSVDQASNQVQSRIFSSILNKLLEIRKEFIDLKIYFQSPYLEKIELEDKIVKLQLDLGNIKKKVVYYSQKLANDLWQKISNSGDEMASNISNFLKIGMALNFLLLALVVYLVYNIVFLVAKPITNLANIVQNYKIGSNFVSSTNSKFIEINSINSAFNKLIQDLNTQFTLFYSYLNVIRNLEKIYIELQSHPVEEELEAPKQRLEKAINTILGHLMEIYEEIDLIKLLLFPRDRFGNPITSGPLYRFGETLFSNRFKSSDEYKEYIESIDCKDEIIPLGEGISGWFFEQVTAPDPGSGLESMNLVYKLPSIQDYPVLGQRKLEKGLRGSLYFDKIYKPNISKIANDTSEWLEIEPLGALFVYFQNPKLTINWQTLVFFKIVVSQLSTLLETHHLHLGWISLIKTTHQLEIAKEIQEKLLPSHIPKLDGLNIHAKSIPAADVGGDFYDCFIIDSNKVGLVVADAAGKNIPAAMLTTVLKTSLSTMDKSKMTASEVLTKVNEIIIKNITSDKFITAAYVILDLNLKEVEVSSAGHNPVLIVSDNKGSKVIQELKTPGFPLGIMEYQYSSVKYKLKENDLIVMFTDGIIDAKNIEREPFGMQRLKKFLAGPENDNIVEGLIDYVNKFSSGMPQQDDMTVLAVKYIGYS